jgi:hypothetical protein
MQRLSGTRSLAASKAAKAASFCTHGIGGLGGRKMTTKADRFYGYGIGGQDCKNWRC